jgi:NitT/TauT family transport system substrate-binding protein
VTRFPVLLAALCKRRSFVLLAIFLAGCGSAPQPQKSSIRIAIGGRAALDFIPVYLASALGFFRDEGIEVTLQDLASTPKALQALLGGSTDVVAGAYDGAVQMSIEGKSIQAIAVLERWPPFAVVVAPQSAGSLRRITDFKGRVVGVASPGSSTHRFLNYLLVRNGLELSDISAVGVGVNFSMAAAVQHGQVDAAVAGPLGMALLSKASTPVILADCRTKQGAQATLGTSDLPSSALMVRPEWSRAHPEILRRLCKAARRSLAWIQAHSPEEISNAMPQEYKGQDSAVYLRGVRDIRPAFSPDGLMPAEGPANVQRFLGVSDQRARNARIDLQMTYTNEFMRSQ